MSDNTYDQILNETDKVADEIQKETILKEKLERAVSNRIEGLINIKEEEAFKNAAKKIISDLVREGFEPVDVTEFLVNQLDNIGRESYPLSMESIVKEMKLNEQEDTFDIMYDHLLPDVQQELLQFLGLESPEEGNLEFSAVAVVPRPEEEETESVEHESSSESKTRNFVDMSIKELMDYINTLTDKVAHEERYSAGSPELTFMKRRLKKAEKEYDKKKSEEEKVKESKVTEQDGEKKPKYNIGDYVTVEGREGRIDGYDAEDRTYRVSFWKAGFNWFEEGEISESKIKKAEEVLRANGLSREEGTTDEQVIEAAENLARITDISKKTNESADVSKDVSELIKQTKDALTAGDYVKAADLAGRLSAIQQTIPDGVDADAAKAAKEEEVTASKKEASSAEEEKDNPCKREVSSEKSEKQEK